MARTILAVPGLAQTSPAFRAALWDMAARNGWDVDAIVAVMANESRFQAGIKNPQRGQTASGLIQFIDSTARALLKELGIEPLPGAGGAAAKVRTLSAEEQLPLVELFYRRAGVRRGARPVDYYLAAWGNGVGKPADFVLARETDARTFNDGADNRYTLNRGLDVDGSGEITVGDVAELVKRLQAMAGGKRVDAEPVISGAMLLATTAPALLAIALVAATLHTKPGRVRA